MTDQYINISKLDIIYIYILMPKLAIIIGPFIYNLGGRVGRRRAVQLLAVLLESSNHSLAPFANHPLGKVTGHLGVRRLLSNKQVSRVQERIVSIV